MASIDPYRLDLSSYPFTIELATRYSDLDTNNHLNNVAIAGFFEDSRVRLHRGDEAEHALADTRGVVASVKIDYLREAFFPTPVTVGTGYGRIGRTSWQVLQAAFQNGVCFAVSETIAVRLDDQGPTPISEGWRAMLERLQVRAP